jgi:hypothetical protein
VDAFIVESYWPGVTAQAVAEVDVRAKAAAVELSSEGTSAQYLDSILIPEDESVFFLLGVGSAEAAEELARRARIRIDRLARCVRSNRLEGTSEVGPA